MGPHAREGVKKHDIHIKPESFKIKLLGELFNKFTSNHHPDKEEQRHAELIIHCKFH